MKPHQINIEITQPAPGHLRPKPTPNNHTNPTTKIQHGYRGAKMQVCWRYPICPNAIFNRKTHSANGIYSIKIYSQGL